MIDRDELREALEYSDNVLLDTAPSDYDRRMVGTLGYAVRAVAEAPTVWWCAEHGSRVFARMGPDGGPLEPADHCCLWTNWWLRGIRMENVSECEVSTVALVPVKKAS